MAREIDKLENNEILTKQSISTQSETHLEDDPGEGTAAVIRVFEFAANPEAFKQHTPTKQELFNYHYKGIEIMLWKDGLKYCSEIQPRLMFSKDGSAYRFVIACLPSIGNTLIETPNTLSQLLHETTGHTD